MKTNPFRIFLLAAIAATAAFAQSSHSINVNVPFSFVAGTRTLPAGGYTVNQNLMTGVLTIGPDASHAAIMVASHGADSPKGADRSGFTFRCYGNTCFLSAVWAQGLGRELPTEKREVEMTPKRRTAAETAVVAVR